MRIVVTGGAGYIGSVTVRLLCGRGHDVTVLDTLENGYREAVDRRAELVVGDVGETAVLDTVLPGADAVMHLAGYIEVAESEAEPERYRDNNVVRPSRMLDAMREHHVRSMVFSSTAAVYGEPGSLPIAEDAPTCPVNVYGATKLAFEEELARREARNELTSIRLRYFNVGGAWADGTLGEAHDPETHIVPRVLRAMLAGETAFEVYGGDYPTADGTCVRDYIHVLDLAQAHAVSLERLGRGREGGVFNLGNGRGYSNLEVLQTCAGVAGVRLEPRIGPRRPGDPAVLVASNVRAGDILGWRPERDLRTIVTDALAWHRSHPNGYR